jgi:cell division protein FtsQ
VSAAAYQGRALWTAPRPRRRGIKPGWIALGVLAAGFLVWSGRDRLARTAPYRLLFLVPRVQVEGCIYLGEAEVRKAAGLDRRVDFLRTDLARARARLLKAPRVEQARIVRALPRRIVIQVVERRQVAIVRGGRLFETDERGVILPPLVSGVLPDVPVVSGVRVADARAGKAIKDPRFARALRHLAALARPAVGLPHPISQVDVTDADRTVVTLAPDGVDVFLPKEPPGPRMLSALRVVLGDLASRGQSAATIDMTGSEVIAVRPVPAAASAQAADSLSRSTRDPRRG